MCSRLVKQMRVSVTNLSTTHALRMQAQGDKDVQPASHSVSTTPATADMSSQTADARQGQAGTSHNDQDRVIQHLHSEIDTLKKKVTSLQSQLQQQLAEHLAAATQSSEADVQAAQQALHAQHAEQMAELKTEFECLLEDYTAKDQQVGGM